MQIETYVDDFKVIDGLKIPHTMRQVNPAMTILIKFTEVKNNIDIEEAKFAKPAN